MNKDDKQFLTNLIDKGIEHEKSKYSDWDDNKHLIKVDIKFVGNNLRLHFTREEKKND